MMLVTLRHVWQVELGRVEWYEI